MVIEFKNKIAFLDRDGVINADLGYVHKLEDLIFLPGVEVGLRQLLKANFKLFIVTNQAGIARGYYTDTHFHQFMEIMLRKLKFKGVEISGYEYCPHHRNGVVPEYTKTCDCRKPEPKMLQRILLREGVEPKDCIIIGDKITDMIAGKNAGVEKRFLINNDKREDEDEIFYQVKNWNQLTKYLQNLDL